MVLGLVACQLISGGDCTSIAVPALAVDVLDSVSGTSLPAQAIAYARDGAFADSATVPPPTPGFLQPAELAWNRAGTYDVSVRSDGYREWVETGVRVRNVNCHPQTAHLTARLVRVP
jgi:hypothetical protein